MHYSSGTCHRHSFSSFLIPQEFAWTSYSDFTVSLHSHIMAPRDNRVATSLDEIITQMKKITTNPRRPNSQGRYRKPVGGVVVDRSRGGIARCNLKSRAPKQPSPDATRNVVSNFGPNIQNKDILELFGEIGPSNARLFAVKPVEDPRVWWMSSSSGGPTPSRPRDCTTACLLMAAKSTYNWPRARSLGLESKIAEVNEQVGAMAARPRNHPQSKSWKPILRNTWKWCRYHRSAK